jgi:hypothetical protein
VLRRRLRRGRRWWSEGEGARPGRQNGRLGWPPPLATGGSAPRSVHGHGQGGRSTARAGIGWSRLGPKAWAPAQNSFSFFEFYLNSQVQAQF